MSDLNVTLETKPALTTEELQDVWEATGDPAFKETICSVSIAGQAPANVAPCNIDIELAERGNGVLEGMQTEVEWFLYAAVQERVDEVTQLDVSEVPRTEEIEAAMEAIDDEFEA